MVPDRLPSALGDTPARPAHRWGVRRAMAGSVPFCDAVRDMERELRSDVVTTLIVDDEPDMRLLIGMSLTLDGACKVTAEAEDGEQGLAAWERDRPDVIVLDMRMPGLSGLDVARRILAVDPTQAIVICSAYLDPADRDEAQRIGVRACVDKTDLEGLAQVVCEVAAQAA